jgi:hypothetical protein
VRADRLGRKRGRVAQLVGRVGLGDLDAGAARQRGQHGVAPGRVDVGAVDLLVVGLVGDEHQIEPGLALDRRHQRRAGVVAQVDDDVVDVGALHRRITGPGGVLPRAHGPPQHHQHQHDAQQQQAGGHAAAVSRRRRVVCFVVHGDKYRSDRGKRSCRLAGSRCTYIGTGGSTQSLLADGIA